jgi:Fe-S cluster biogenesis protein NfuA
MARPETTESDTARPPDLNAVGERIEQILGELEQLPDPKVREKTEDLVHTLLEFYGAGLARIVELVGATGSGGTGGAEATAAGGERLLHTLAADPVVKGLLILHDLHPQDTLERITAALDGVRPYLGTHAGDVEMLGIDDEGVLRLALKGTCDGCPSSTITVKYAIEKAIHDAAPEITGIDVAGVVAEPPKSGPGGRTLLPLETLECPVPEAP